METNMNTKWVTLRKIFRFTGCYWGPEINPIILQIQIHKLVKLFTQCKGQKYFFGYSPETYFMHKLLPSMKRDQKFIWPTVCTWSVQRETNFSWLYLVYASCNEPNQGSAALQDFATLFLSLNAILVHVWQYLVAILHACKKVNI
jgi:hypothetical protein